MPLMELLFSFQGRMRRSHWWAVQLGSLGVFFVAAMAARLIVHLLGAALQSQSTGDMLIGLTFVPLVIAYCWANLAANVKRLHDQNMSGWMVLLGFIPFFTLIVMGCLDGTPHRNKYGPSPKFPDNQAAVFS